MWKGYEAIKRSAVKADWPLDGLRPACQKPWMVSTDGCLYQIMQAAQTYFILALAATVDRMTMLTRA